MRKTQKDIRCPLEYGLEVFGGKWKSRIICVLNEKSPLRYNEILNEMINISDFILAKSLKELISSGLIERKSYNEIPPRVEYNLTKKGKSVIPILQEICKCSGIFHKENSKFEMSQCKKNVTIKIDINH